MLDHGARREREVRAGVAVGNRVDVEVVDALAALLDRGQREPRELESLLERTHESDRLTSSMWTSSERTGRPVIRSTS